MSEMEKYQTIRVSLERSITVSTRQVEGMAFVRGGLGGIHWAEFQSVGQAIINLVRKLLRVKPPNCDAPLLRRPKQEVFCTRVGACGAPLQFSVQGN